jgi:hypothetical protein
MTRIRRGLATAAAATALASRWAWRVAGPGLGS